MFASWCVSTMSLFHDFKMFLRFQDLDFPINYTHLISHSEKQGFEWSFVYWGWG